MTDTDTDDPAIRTEDFDLSPEEIHEVLESRRYVNDFRPSYDPDWGDGQIHLDGEKDFPADMAGDEVAEMLAERVEVVGGMVTEGQEGGGHYFTVSSQFGALLYRCHYPEPGEPVERIEFTENDGYTGEEEFTAEYPVAELIDVCTFLRRVMENAEWTIDA